MASSGVVKVILSFYRNDEGSAFERHRGRVPFDIEKHNSMEIACKHLIEFMGIKQQAEKCGLGGFVLKLFRLENPSFVDLVELLTLLTTQVENLHAVSHFKHETFSALNYSQDFGTIEKESLKRITKWAAKYFTHDRSYYPVPDTSMPLSALSTMALPAVQRVTKEDEAAMKEWMENCRPVRQRTVRSETTKDKAGALPPAVYSQAKQKNIPMWSLIGSKQFLTTQQRLLLSLRPLSS